jgi:hypothetical protein
VIPPAVSGAGEGTRTLGVQLGMRKLRISLHRADLISRVTAEINIMCAKLMGASSICQENGRLRAFFFAAQNFLLFKGKFLS